ncbi:MAG: CDP-alcohol phosphatidyltransferase family protein [Candidatus Uhrbacteria bacterium]|nr:CDP-alcohol phosphatidyltransferase family protein [Candidatus Uhrbacteria bacterium]
MTQDENEDLLDAPEVHEAAEWLSKPEFSQVSGFSNRVASWFDWTRPNLITMTGMVLCLPMAYFFLQTDLLSTAIGAVITIICFLCDWLDGALARYQDKKYGLKKLSLEEERLIPIWRRFFLRGSSNLGTALDPFADKVKYYVALFTRGWGYVSTTLIIISFVTAIALTLVRPIKRYFKIGDAAANRAGKYKIFIEVAVVAVIVLVPHNETTQIISNTLLVGAMIFGFLSLSAHLFLAKYADMKVKRVAKRLARKEKKRSKGTVHKTEP